MLSRVGRLLSVALGGVAALLSGSVLAATGNNLRQINGGYSQGSCGINTGIAFDGTHLMVSCWSYNVIDLLSPVDGSLVGSKAIAGFPGFGALAWDGTRNMLWACNSGTEEVVLIDMTAGTGVTKFPSQGCIDGLAYDGSDDTIWASPDVASTVTHYSTTGTVLGSFNISGHLGSCGNSGIAVGGSQLFLANNGCSQIYTANKDGTNFALFASFPARLEDLECDDKTFASQGVGAIWSIDAYDRTLNAWETPAGLCGSGGLAPGPVAPRQPAPALQWPAVVGLGSALCLLGVKRSRKFR